MSDKLFTDDTTSSTISLTQIISSCLQATSSNQRLQIVEQWLTTDPNLNDLQTAVKELSSKDSGIVKLIRDRIELNKQKLKQQDLIATWQQKAQQILHTQPFNLANAVAWQRDASKHEVPLSQPILQEVKQQLQEQITLVEGINESILIHKEKSILLAQRIESYSTKSIRNAKDDYQLLQRDISDWQNEASKLLAAENNKLIDNRYIIQLETAGQHLQSVWQAFSAELNQATIALENNQSKLPKVLFWANEITQLRNGSSESNSSNISSDKQQTELIQQTLTKLQKQIDEGHSKSALKLAHTLRQQLKDSSQVISSELVNLANKALIATKELEDWQRWRADDIRKQLITKAKSLTVNEDDLTSIKTGLVEKEITESQVEQQSNTQSTTEEISPQLPKSTYSPKKIQQILQDLREQWRITDLGGVTNNELWLEFDNACNKAYLIVKDWLQQIKQQSQESLIKRQQLIDQVNAWSQQQKQQSNPDWKKIHKNINHFIKTWKNLGHVTEKQFSQLQPLWQQALTEAKADLRKAQKQSIATRNNLITQAKNYATNPNTSFEQIKQLQQLWQQDAQQIALDFKLEHKLWAEFKQATEVFFQRRKQTKEQLKATHNIIEQKVLDAIEQLEQSISQQSASSIQNAINNLQQTMQFSKTSDLEQESNKPQLEEDNAIANLKVEHTSNPEPDNSTLKISEKPTTNPVIARRGDDRPDSKIANSKTILGDKNNFNSKNKKAKSDNKTKVIKSVRLSNQVFFSARNSLAKAQQSLRKLAAQAHGQAITQLLQAWQQRNDKTMPALSELSTKITPAVYQVWRKALSEPAISLDKNALIRLEIVAQIATPAQDLETRRNLQIQILTQGLKATEHNWHQDLALVFNSTYNQEIEQRLLQILKTLLK